MERQLIISITTLDPNQVVKEIPQVIDTAGYSDLPIESFMEHPNGFGRILLDIVTSGSGPDPRYPRLSLILIELRTLLHAFGFHESQLKKLQLTEEPNTVVLTLE